LVVTSLSNLFESGAKPQIFLLLDAPTAVFFPTVPSEWVDYVYKSLKDSGVSYISISENDKCTGDLVSKLLNTVPSVRSLNLTLIDDINNMDNLLESIKQSKWLQRGEICFNQSNPDVMNCLIDVLGSNESLKSLTLLLEGYKFDKKIVDFLTPVLRQNKSIAELSITCWEVDMTPDDWLIFEDIITNDENLTEMTLDTPDTDLDQQICCAYKILQKSKSIKNLTLNRNALAREDIFSLLCSVLATNKAINVLYFDLLGQDFLDPEKLQKIFQILNTRNIRIAITFNGSITEEGPFNEFLDLIEKNLVTELHLDSYYFDPSFMGRFFNSLKKNISIEAITFREVTWDTDQPRRIAEYLESAKQLKSLQLVGAMIINETSLLWLLGGINKSNLESITFEGILRQFGSDLVCKELAKNTTVKTLEGYFDMKSDKNAQLFCELLARNDTLTSVTIPRQDLDDAIKSGISTALANNWNITKFGKLLQGREQPILQRNRKYYGDIRSNTIILATNIVRSEEAKNLLPIEIWKAIFGYLNYPGLHH
jgi:hypothetical protein